METSLFRYIWKYSKKQQIIILLITFVSWPILYFSLDLPKQIINDAIDGNNFPRVLFGFELTQIEFLLVLCFSYLLLVTLNGVIKYVFNVYKGLTGERMLRRLRYQLYQRILRFRLPYFSRISSGEIIPMITSELQTVGGFIGDSISLPAFQGGMLLVYLYFIFSQDPILGVAAIALYPVQGYLIPKLQKRVNLLAKARVKNLRQLSDKVGESVAGIADIHANDTSAFHRAEITDKLHSNFEIRFEIFKRKFLIKFVNNFINQLTPFFFYSVGGYLVIKGNITFGALVAVLAAYKDLAGPWKELLTYYQQLADIRIKYQTVIEQFDPPDMYDQSRLDSIENFDLEAAGALSFSNVTFAGEGAGQDLHDVSITMPLKSKIAVIGGEGSGRAQFLQLAAGLLSPESGQIELGSTTLDILPHSVLGRVIGYASAAPHIFNSSIRFNLYYGLRHGPDEKGLDELLGREERQNRRNEAARTGNIEVDVKARWENLAEAGVENATALEETALKLVCDVGLGDDIYRMGLQTASDQPPGHDVQARILSARKALIDKAGEDKSIADFVELWNFEHYNRSATLLENLFFALPGDRNLKMEEVAALPEITEAIRLAGIESLLVQMGHDITVIMLDLFSDAASQSQVLSSFNFINPDEFPLFSEIVQHVKDGFGALDESQCSKLVGVAFKLTPARHRLGIMGPENEAKILEARKVVHAYIKKHLSHRFALFDTRTYIDGLTIEDNLLFGRPRLDRPNSRKRAEELIVDVVERFELKTIIMQAGLSFQVGVGGARLSAGQRLKIGLVRVLLRRPGLLIVDDIMDGRGSEADHQLLDVFTSLLPSGTILVGMAKDQMADRFDQTFTLVDGRMTE